MFLIDSSTQKLVSRRFWVEANEPNPRFYALLKMYTLNFLKIHLEIVNSANNANL